MKTKIELLANDPSQKTQELMLDEFNLEKVHYFRYYYHILGLLYQKMNNYSKAGAYYLEAARIQEPIKDLL